jgi:hydrogenase expression/formation protein HypC
MGTVDFGGVRREVCLAYLDEDVRVGDYAIVHVGFAISRIDEAEAERTFALLEEMGELEELGRREAGSHSRTPPHPPEGR